MNAKEMFLQQLEVKIPYNLMHYNINLYKRNEDTPYAALITNSSGVTILRCNPWDDVDGVKIVI